MATQLLSVVRFPTVCRRLSALRVHWLGTSRADTGVILSSSDLPHLGQRITKLLGTWRHASDPILLDKSDMDKIQLSISPTFH